MNNTILIYSVQTFYGTHEKCFLHKYNALSYANKLRQLLSIDSDLIELYPVSVSQDDFIHMDIDD